MEIFVYIGLRLREVRENMGLSQTEFAAIAEKAGAMGATRQSQSNYEKGKRTPDAAYLAAIAAAGADVQYILTGIKSTTVATQEPPLTPRQRALLDNYDHTDDMGKSIIEATAFEAAQQKALKKRA